MSFRHRAYFKRSQRHSQHTILTRRQSIRQLGNQQLLQFLVCSRTYQRRHKPTRTRSCHHSGHQVGIQERLDDSEVVVTETCATGETERGRAVVFVDCSVEATFFFERDVVGL